MSFKCSKQKKGLETAQDAQITKWALEKYGKTMEFCHTLPKLDENGHDLGGHSDKVQRFGTCVKLVSTSVSSRIFSSREETSNN